MTMDEILAELTAGTTLPEAALAAAQTQKPAVTKRLLALLEAEVAAPGSGDADLSAGVLLLGEWREPKAFPLLCRLMACPTEQFEAIFSDVMGNHLDAVLAQTYDGNPQPLFEGVVDGDIDEEASVAYLGALARLVHDDKIDSKPFEAFLVDIYPLVATNDASFLGHAWTKAVAALGLTALAPQAKQLFDTGGVILVIGTYAEFEADLQAAVADPDHAFADDAAYYQPLTTAASVMQTWQWP
jgi:Protein of unknown function (DUF1186)